MQPEASIQGGVKRMMYVGVDVGKSKCRASMMNTEGKIMKELDFCNNSQGISNLTSLLSMDDHVVMESTGSYWLDLYNHLDDLHIPVVHSKSAFSAVRKSE
jgi:transposase